MITHDEVVRLVTYDPLTGVFMRLKRTSNFSDMSKPAGSLSHWGYLEFRLQGKLYKAHRLAWLYVHGVWPSEVIDHINGVKTDNRLANLRAVSGAVNNQNRRVPGIRNSGNPVGAYPDGSAWRSQLSVNNKTKYLGTFITADQAREAYLKAKRELHEGCTI